MKSYKQHVRSDATKWVLTAIAIVLIAVMLTAIITDGFKDGNPYCWFGHDFGEDDVCTKCGAIKEAEVKEDEQPKEDPKEDNKTPVEENPVEGTPVDDEPLENGGADVTSIRNEGNMRLAVKRGVQTPVGENTYVLTATIAPAEADNVNVTWAVAWKNPSSTFATGKNVTDYVTVAAQSGNNLNATVTCKQAFGEQVIVTVTSVDNAAAKASCTVDYVERITGITLNMPSLTTNSASFTYSFATTPCTINAELSLNFASTASLTSAFAAELGDALDTYANIYGGFVPYYMESSAICSVEDKTMSLSFRETTGSNAFSDSCNGHTGFLPNKLISSFILIDEDALDNDPALEGYILLAFRTAIEQVSGAHATVEISYTSFYNGQTYSSATKNIDLRFDGSPVTVPVGTLSLNEDNIIF